MADPTYYWQPGATVAAHWLDLISPDDTYSASVKWDGCLELYGDGPQDHLHICDVPDLIARLQALQALAEAHFGTWPG